MRRHDRHTGDTRQRRQRRRGSCAITWVGAALSVLSATEDNEHIDALLCMARSSAPRPAVESQTSYDFSLSGSCESAPPPSDVQLLGGLAQPTLMGVSSASFSASCWRPMMPSFS
jgi:hypothetical protein